MDGEQPVVAIMTPSPHCVRDDAPIAEVAAMLVRLSVSGMPVVDAAGKAIGVITKTDLVAHTSGKGLADAKVGDIMMPVVFAIDATTSIGRAAALMAAEGVHRLPVVDPQGGVIGIVSSLDVVRWFAQHAGYAV